MHIINALQNNDLILAHTNVKLFITSGGFMSITESIHYEKSLLTIPLTPEQWVICEKLYRQNAAYMLNLNEITYDNLIHAVEHVLNYNSNNVRNLKQLKNEFLLNLDAVKPLKKALNAIDMTLRTNGLVYLRPHSHNLNFWSSILMDVTVILIVGLLTILAIPFIFTSCLLKKSHQNQKEIKLLNKNHRNHDFLTTTIHTKQNKHKYLDDFNTPNSTDSDIHDKRKRLSLVLNSNSSCCYCSSH